MGLASRWRVEEAGVSFTVCACVCVKVCVCVWGGGGGGRVWVCSTFERERCFFLSYLVSAGVSVTRL